MNEKQYNAVVAQNKSLQGELRLANKIIEVIANELNMYDDCLGWGVDLRCETETISCEECIKQRYMRQALQELEAENGLH